MTIFCCRCRWFLIDQFLYWTINLYIFSLLINTQCIGTFLNWYVRAWLCFIHPDFQVFFRFVGEDYQVVKMGREYHGCGEEYNVEIG